MILEGEIEKKRHGLPFGQVIWLCKVTIFGKSFYSDKNWLEKIDD